MIYLIGLGTLLFHFGDFWSATWWSKWTFLALAFAWVFSAWGAKKTHLLYLPLMWTTLLYAVLSAFQMDRGELGKLFPIDVIIVMERNALFTCLTAVVAIWAFAEFRPPRSAKNVLCLIWAIGIACYLAMPDLPNHGWEFGNPSMGACLLAALLPLVWERGYPIVSWVLTALVIWKSHTSIPIGVLAVITIAYWCKEFGKGVIAGGLFLVGLFGGARFLLGADLFDNNGRLPIWKLAYAWAREHGFLLGGMGAGTVQTIVPILQMQTHTRLPDFFIWLHSDWLQILVEFGWVGLSATLVAFSRLSWKAFRTDRALFASLLGFAGMGLFNYPLRMPIHFLCLLLVCCSIEHGIAGRPQERSLCQRAS